MDILIACGFILCMVYLFYERENRSKPRANPARAARSSSKGKRSTKKQSK